MTKIIPPVKPKGAKMLHPTKPELRTEIVRLKTIIDELLNTITEKESDIRVIKNIVQNINQPDEK